MNEYDILDDLGCNGVSAEKLFDDITQAAASINAWDGEEVQGSELTRFCRELSMDARAELVFQAVTFGSTTGQGLDRNSKEFALVLAEKMGPDWAQELYKLAVLVTKLA